MGNKLTQTQEQRQEQKLVQAITQQQLLQAQLVELPITQLLERINTEMDDNPALEVNADAPDDLESQDFLESQEDDEDFDSQREREDRQSALDDALAGIGRDDEELPVYHGGNNVGEDNEALPY